MKHLLAGIFFGLSMAVASKALGKDQLQTGLYLVYFVYAPTLRYAGDVAGLRATVPSARGRFDHADPA